MEEAEVSDPRGISYSRPLEFFDFGTLYTLVLNTTCNTTPTSTNFDSKSSRMWFCTIPDSGTHLVPVPSLQPAYLPPVNKRASGPQQAKQGEELEKEKNQRGGLHKCVKSYRVDGTARNSESRKRV